MRLLLLFLLTLSPMLHAADGQRLFQSCTKCHGSKGEKTIFSRPIGGWSVGKVTEALRAYRSGERNLRGQGSIMRQRAQGLSDREIDALAAYIATLK
jgi:cytochrome c553